MNPIAASSMVPLGFLSYGWVPESGSMSGTSVPTLNQPQPHRHLRGEAKPGGLPQERRSRSQVRGTWNPERLGLLEWVNVGTSVAMTKGLKKVENVLQLSRLPPQALSLHNWQR